MRLSSWVQTKDFVDLFTITGGDPMQDAVNGEEWKRIAEQVAKEADPEKLALLVEELCDAFDLARKQTRPGSLDEGEAA